VKILYDGQIYADQTTGGISRYFKNIITRLPHDIQPTLTASYRANKNGYPSHPHLQLQEFPNFRPYRIAHKLRSHYFRWFNASQHFDIAHPTYYFQLTRESFSSKNGTLIVTIHDMIHELFADSIDPKGYTINAKKNAIDSAHKLICVSENTRRDLIRIYPQVEAKIVVIYEASELSEKHSYGSEIIPIQPYFLYVGNREKAYKNFDTLLIAFAKVVGINPDILLCVVGAPFNDREQRQIADLKLTTRIHHYHHASDTHLAKLYRCSVAFVYPSLYEGFGIPPLEAMACGTVVVAANSSSIPEVVGDAGILFEPKAVEDLADILLELLDSPSKREDMITKGFDRNQQFSWDKTAAKTMEVYKSLQN
jgi:glycosyltransferase involved in cell wall biosynthesis